MKKIIVIGSGGAGKSTFSGQLGEKLGIPVVHLDKLFWHPNWTRTPEDEWFEIIRREIARDEWIMDGNFGGTRQIRMQACDTVIFLDMPSMALHVSHPETYPSLSSRHATRYGRGLR